MTLHGGLLILPVQLLLELPRQSPSSNLSSVRQGQRSRDAWVFSLSPVYLAVRKRSNQIRETFR